MPKQLTKTDMKKMSGGVAMGKALDASADYSGDVGGGGGAPAGIRNGTARLSSLRCTQSDSGWVRTSVVGVVTSPEEHKNLQVYPEVFGWYPDDFNDDAKTEDIVKRCIDFMARLGVTEERIAQVKAKGKDFMGDFMDAIEERRGHSFKFSSQKPKKVNPKYPDTVNYYANGGVEEAEVQTAAEPVQAQEDDTAGYPEVGERWVWEYEGQKGNYSVVAVNTEAGIVDLEGDDGVRHEGVQWSTLGEFLG